MDGQEKSRAEEFLELYRQLEDALEERYRNQRRRCSSVIMEFSREEDSAPVREKLEVCRELRNLLAHSGGLQGQPVAEPSQPVMEALGEVLRYVKRPPLAMEFAVPREKLMTAWLDQKVLRLMEQMDQNGYSHIPVIQNGQFGGVFSVGTIFRYQLCSGGKALTPDTTLRELKKYLEPGEHLENYEFVGKDATYFTVRKLFERPRGKNRRISVIFITEDGRQDQRLLGMLTPWDVLGK